MILKGLAALQRRRPENDRDAHGVSGTLLASNAGFGEGCNGCNILKWSRNWAA